jgi:hypothetical protein
MYDTERLAEFFHPAEIAIVAVTVHAYRYVELDLIVRVVRLRLSNVPWHARSAEHDAGEAEVEGVGCRHSSNIFGPTDPDAVVGEEFFCFVYAVAELGCPLVDVVEET